MPTRADVAQQLGQRFDAHGAALRAQFHRLDRRAAGLGELEALLHGLTIKPRDDVQPSAAWRDLCVGAQDAHEGERPVSDSPLSINDVVSASLAQQNS